MVARLTDGTLMDSASFQGGADCVPELAEAPGADEGRGCSCGVGVGGRGGGIALLALVAGLGAVGPRRGGGSQKREPSRR